MNHNFLGCEIRHEFYDLIIIDITISMYRTSMFFSDVAMISYFNVMVNIIIIIEPTFQLSS